MDRVAVAHGVLWAAIGGCSWCALDLSVSVSPSDSYVIVDGRPWGKADGRLIPLSPGKHVVAGRHAGYEDAVDPRTWAGGDAPWVDLVLKPLPVEQAAPAPSAVPHAGPQVSASNTATLHRGPWWTPLVPTLSPRGAALVLGYASVAVGLVTAGLTVGFEVDRANLARGHQADTCTGQNTTSAFCTAVHERREQRNISGGVAVGFGTFAIGTGLAIVLSDVFGPRAGGGRVAPVVGQDGGGLLVRGAW